jgi:aryl-phospho-beta-D-glucosidase BglC (GH1 family)
MKYANLLILVLALTSHVYTAAGDKPASAREWWNQPYPSTFDASQLKNKPPFISVKGNRFVDEEGKTFVFRGVNISDPDKLVHNGHWNKKHFEMAKSFGANVLRVPIHPVAWRRQGKENYFDLLDQAVRWANELDLYLIIDWHSIGNLETGVFQHPMYETSKAETLNFWRSVAHRYQGIPTVAVYEIFNEPTDFIGQLGKADWKKWKEFNELAISIIYAHDKKVIPLVAGFNWAYDLTPVAKAPIAHVGKDLGICGG